MWSGVESDVELYASGVVVDDDGDFSGGQALNDGDWIGWLVQALLLGRGCSHVTY